MLMGIFGLLGLIVLGFYFVPTILAWFNGKKLLKIFIVNLLFGWTLIGWVICLFWAIKKGD